MRKHWFFELFNTGKKDNILEDPKSSIKQAYEILAESYDARIDTKPHNAFYDRPNTLSLFSEIVGKRILDAACGPGKYAQILYQKGASEVVGFDISPAMIERAIIRNGNKGIFFVHDLDMPIPIEEGEGFDYILCALALHYLEDTTVAMSEFHRLLKPNGQLIVSVEHPFYDYLYYKSNNYFNKERVGAIWKGFGSAVNVECFRRSLGDTISQFTNNGFVIDQILEPMPTKEFEKADPRHYKELMSFPAFLCIRAIKN
ncbi:MAG: class I SAM-dependent methyltransferase [Saprospiraceae bacterium]|nr:class I SAM-dependent methyltransferase [Saprospiraceae bacterium]